MEAHKRNANNNTDSKHKRELKLCTWGNKTAPDLNPQPGSEQLWQLEVAFCSISCVLVRPTRTPVYFLPKEVLKYSRTPPTTALQALTGWGPESWSSLVIVERFSQNCVLWSPRSFISRCSESDATNTFLPISICRTRRMSRLMKAAGVSSHVRCRHLLLVFLRFELESVNVFSFFFFFLPTPTHGLGSNGAN